LKAYKPLSLFAIAVFAILVWSCERDDICAENTVTTPRLVIDFYNIANTDEEKSVSSLRVIAVDDEGLAIDTLNLEEGPNPSRIKLPLRFQEAGTLTVTRYLLEKDANLASDDNPNTSSNADLIEIRYTPEFIYVSRACGYKSIFQFGFNGSVLEQTDEDNWIISTEQLIQTVDNEDEVHYILYH
jgi:hypothetical protein